MPRIPLYFATATAATTALLGAFVFGMRVNANDERLFASYDRHQAEVISQACGARGVLLQNPRSYEYSCIYTNKDGTTLVQPVLDAPLILVRN